MNHLFIFDKNENLLDLLNSECYYDDDYKRQLNGEWSFTFYVKSDYLKYLEKPNKIGLYDREGKFQLFKIQECEDVFGNEESFEIYCVHDSYSLGELIIEDKRVIGGTARDAIAKCLENSNYSIGNVADLGEETLSFYFISKLQGLYNIVETYGGELDFRFELNENKTRIVNRYVDLKYRLGEDTGLRFTFDLNLKGVTRNRSSEGHFTVLYGRGKSLEVGEGYSRRLTFDEVAWNTPTNPLNKPLGDKFLIDPEAVARWGRIEGIYENDAIEDAEELLKATHRALDEAKEPKISYSATIEDLSNLSGYEHLKFVLGDSIIIQDEKYKLNNEARIVSEAYSIKNKKQPKQVTLGYIQKGISDSLSGGSITNPTITAPTDIEIDDSDFPNTLPSTPILKAKGLFSSIMLEWTFESKTYYNYEIYASKIQNFNPDSSNLIFKGKASSLLHEVKPSETWYYRARAINTHGEVTEMSDEVSATAFKISDATEYFEDVAIKEALIDTLSLDRGWFGQLKGQFMDVKNLVVTDGNNVRTMYVDDFGRVHMNVSELKINSKDVLNQEQTETLIEAKAGEISLSVAKKEIDIARGEITDKIAQINIDVDSITNEVSSIKDSSFGGNNLVTNGNFSNGTSHWEATKYNGPGIFEFAVFNEDNSNSWCLNNKKIGWCSAEDLPIEESVIGEWALCQEFDTVIGQTYTVSYFISGHRSSKSVVIRNGLGALWDDISEQKWYGHLNGGKADSGWKWDSITFVAQHTKSVVWFRMHGRIAEYDDVNSMYLWIADVCCVEGKMASKWIPNIDEYYNRTEANTLIQQTADGINETLNKTIEISKSEAINQANLTTDNKLQSYPTKTEMNIEIDKRANGIVSTVKKIEKSLVTDNLLMEGDFSNNLHSWRYYDQGYPISCEAQNSSDWIMPAKVALHLNASYHPAGVDSGITQTFYTKWYTNYTITGYIASHRAEGMVILKDDAGNWLTFDKTNPDQDDYTGGSDIARWRRVKFTYYSGERGQMQLCLALAKSNENGHVWFHDFMITEGDDELCWKPSVRETRTQISQLNDKIETKASIDNMWSYIQQNPYAVMTAINNGRGINGISIDENGLNVFRNNIISMMLNDGKTQLYNPYSGTYMGYFGTEDNDLRVQLTGASTFSVRGGYNDVRMLDLDFNHGHAYGNSTMRICGDVLFQHRDNPNATGVNGLGLGNDDRADMYGHHNIFLLCHNSFGIADNNGYTNMFADARRGRWIMKGGLYQNTESPPSAYILSIDEEHPFFCGKTKMNIVDSILNLETTIKVDNEDDLTMMILPNDDDLVMTDIGNQKHIDQSSIIAGLVETVKLLNNRMLELESELNKRGR